MATLTNIIKGDSIDFECNVGEVITGWAIRAEVYDSSSHSIKLANDEITGGDSDQIEITDATLGKFTVKVAKDLTTNFDRQSNIEIKIETADGKIFTVYQNAIEFLPETITWDKPDK